MLGVGQVKRCQNRGCLKRATLERFPEMIFLGSFSISLILCWIPTKEHVTMADLIDRTRHIVPGHYA